LWDSESRDSVVDRIRRDSGFRASRSHIAARDSTAAVGRQCDGVRAPVAPGGGNGRFIPIFSGAEFFLTYIRARVVDGIPAYMTFGRDPA